MISVIVPIYKVEKYVEACINSLLNQSYRDFELILVDDGSPDDSLRIVESVLAKGTDVSVHIIRKSNGGVSSARNVGITRASGEYVIMIDSDDVISSDFLQEFVDLINKYPSNNIYSASYFVCFEREYGEFGNKESLNKCLNWKDAQIAFYDRTIKFLLPTLLIKKDFLVSNCIRFDEDVRYSEDVQFIWRCLAYNREDVIHSERIVYHYILHDGSTMTASDINKIKTSLNGVKRLYSETQDLYCEEIKDSLVARLYFSMLHGASRMLDKDSFKQLYDDAGCKPYIKMQASEGMLKSRIVSLILLVSRPLGYLLMRKF